MFKLQTASPWGLAPSKPPPSPPTASHRTPDSAQTPREQSLYLHLSNLIKRPCEQMGQPPPAGRGEPWSPWLLIVSPPPPPHCFLPGEPANHSEAPIPGQTGGTAGPRLSVDFTQRRCCVSGFAGFVRPAPSPFLKQTNVPPAVNTSGSSNPFQNLLYAQHRATPPPTATNAINGGPQHGKYHPRR